MGRRPRRYLLVALFLSLVACGQPAARVAVNAAAGSTPTAAATATAAATPTKTPSPTVTATATKRPSPTATATVAKALAPTATPPPMEVQRGKAPAGWNVYKGTSPSFTMIYPQSWRVQEATQNGVMVVDFMSPDGTGEVAVGASGKTVAAGRTIAAADLRELMDETFASICEKTKVDDATRNDTIAGMSFISVGIGCDLRGVRMYLYFAATVKDRALWFVAYATPDSDFERNFEAYFAPMLNSMELRTP
jgi:hypothetical protein